MIGTPCEVPDPRNVNEKDINKSARTIGFAAGGCQGGRPRNRTRQIFFGSAVQAPFRALLLTQVSMKAMPIQPSSTLAYLLPSPTYFPPAFHLRTSASKQ